MANADEVFNKVVAFSAHASQSGVEFLNVSQEAKVVAFRRGSVVGNIRVIEVDNGIVFVRIYIPIVWKPKRIDGNTLLKLMQMNSKMTYGALGYDKDANIIDYSYTLLGNTLDAEEMFAALTIMSNYADDIDEELCQLTGGERGVDYIRKHL